MGIQAQTIGAPGPAKKFPFPELVKGGAVFRISEKATNYTGVSAGLVDVVNEFGCISVPSSYPVKIQIVVNETVCFVKRSSSSPAYSWRKIIRCYGSSFSGWPGDITGPITQGPAGCNDNIGGPLTIKNEAYNLEINGNGSIIWATASQQVTTGAGSSSYCILPPSQYDRFDLYLRVVNVPSSSLSWRDYQGATVKFIGDF